MMTKTQLIRQALRDGQPRTAVEIEALTGIAAVRVGALLKHDIQKGRACVIKDEDSRASYRMTTPAEQIQQRIDQAKAFLEKWGYTVTKGGVL